MFKGLGQKLDAVFKNLSGRGVLREEDLDLAARDIRVALLEADVALPVVREVIARIKEKAVGQTIIQSVQPAQQVVKIVQDELVELLGGKDTPAFKIDGTPGVILMAGLQGAGKTTSSAKLAKYLAEKQRKKVLMASLDVRRPAAREQLRTLGEQIGVATFPIDDDKSVESLTKRAMDMARIEAYDVLILDTAGRLSIDQEMMDEVAMVHKLSKAHATLLVVDAMTGQDAVHTAQNFKNTLPLTGVVITRIDGDARGGAALSMKSVTGAPILFMGTGEKTDALEIFDADRIAGRILGMGDIVSLVENAMEVMDQEETAKQAEKMLKGDFNLDDLRAQLKNIQAMAGKSGGLGGLMGMIPGMSGMMDKLPDGALDPKILIRQDAILSSMTKEERRKPDILNAKRRKRIAAGSGTTVQDVNKLLKSYEQMRDVMKKLKKMGLGGMMGKMMGGGGMPSPDQLGLPANMPMGGPLGANPFTGGMPQGMPALPPSMLRGGKKAKKRK